MAMRCSIDRGGCGKVLTITEGAFCDDCIAKAKIISNRNCPSCESLKADVEYWSRRFEAENKEREILWAENEKLKNKMEKLKSDSWNVKEENRKLKKKLELIIRWIQCDSLAEWDRIIKEYRELDEFH